MILIGLCVAVVVLVLFYLVTFVKIERISKEDLDATEEKVRNEILEFICGSSPTFRNKVRISSETKKVWKHWGLRWFRMNVLLLNVTNISLEEGELESLNQLILGCVKNLLKKVSCRIQLRYLKSQ